MELYQKKLKRYIFVATKTEAQAFVEIFELNKSKRDGYTVYHDKTNTMEVIVSGVGVANAAKAANAFSFRRDDAVFNIGIAAAPPIYPLGSVQKIGSVFYHDKTISLGKGVRLETIDSACTIQKEHFIDMEGFGFASVLSNIALYKIVSDHFEPQKLTKENVKKLMKKGIVQLFNNSHRACS